MLKNKLLYLGVFILFSTTGFAQAFEKGTSVVSLGYGVGNLSKFIFNEIRKNTQQFDYRSTGPFLGKYEYGVTDHIGVGISIAHVGVNASFGKMIEDTLYTGSLAWRNTSVLGRVNYHFAQSERLDVFLGAGIGFRFGRSKLDVDYERPDVIGIPRIPVIFPLGFETTVGVRYFLLENVGL